MQKMKMLEQAAVQLVQDRSEFQPCWQGGKGRTGLMVSAFLLWTGHRRCALDALELFTFRRTRDYDIEVKHMLAHHDSPVTFFSVIGHTY